MGITFGKPKRTYQPRGRGNAAGGARPARAWESAPQSSSSFLDFGMRDSGTRDSGGRDSGPRDSGTTKMPPRKGAAPAGGRGAASPRAGDKAGAGGGEKSLVSRLFGGAKGAMAAVGPQEPPHFITLTRRLQEEQGKRQELEQQNALIVEKMRHYQERMIDLMQDFTKENVLVHERENELARLRVSLNLAEKKNEVDEQIKGKNNLILSLREQHLRDQIAQLEIVVDQKNNEADSLRRQLAQNAELVAAVERKLERNVDVKRRMWVQKKAEAEFNRIEAESMDRSDSEAKPTSNGSTHVIEASETSTIRNGMGVVDIFDTPTTRNTSHSDLASGEGSHHSDLSNGEVVKLSDIAAKNEPKAIDDAIK